MKRLGPIAAAILLGWALASCSTDSSVAPGTRSISGRVTLRGYYVHVDGTFAGTRVMDDADGVPVELVFGTQVIARTTTVHGIYRFTGLRAGGYYARARIVPGVEDETLPLIVADRDVAARDTLKLVSIGDLYPCPNPFADSIRVFFEMHDTAQVEMDLRDVAGRKLRTLLNLELRPFVYSQSWTMTDPIPPGSPPILYWVTLESGDDVRAQLLVREAPAPLADR